MINPLFRYCAVFLAAMAPVLAGATAIPFATPVDAGHDFGEVADLHWADMDADGDDDIVGVSATDHRIIVWSHEVDDTWRPVTVALAAAQPRSVDVGDIDDDGDLDILTASPGAVPSGTGGRIDWWENRGESWQMHPVAAYPGAVAASLADTNGDGSLDVVAGSVTMGRTGVFMNRDRGANWSTSHMVDSAIPGASALDTGDFDGDGDTDVAALSMSSNRLYWYENASGDSTRWDRHVVWENPGAPSALDAADVDRDGDLDLAVGNGHFLHWYENTGEARGWARHETGASVQRVRTVQVRDLDGDSDHDLVMSTVVANTVLWRENRDGSGRDWASYTISSGTEGSTLISLADPDNDGDLDIAGGQSDGMVRVYPNVRMHSQAQFGARRQIWGIEPTGYYGMGGFRVADLDNDGDPDVIGIGMYPSNLFRGFNTGAGWDIRLDTLVGDALAVGDINRDGKPDAVANDRSGGRLIWYSNVGQRSALVPVELASGTPSVVSVELADLDDDGDVDVVAGNESTHAVDWWANLDGAGGRWEKRAVGAMTAPRTLAVADFDHDGDSDLAVSQYRDGSGNTAATHWFSNPGRGGGTWNRGIVHDQRYNYGSGDLQPIDIDHDGDIDLFGPGFNGQFNFYLNTRWTGGWDRHGFPTGGIAVPNSTHAADLDDDGDLDFAITGDNAATWVEWDRPNFIPHALDTGLYAAWISSPHSLAVVDVDGNGTQDVIASAPSSVAGLHWWPSTRGHYRLDGHPVAGATIGPGNDVGLLGVRMRHLGRRADPSSRLRTLRLQWDDANGTPLTADALRGLIQRISLFVDDGDGRWEPHADTRVGYFDTAGLTLVDGLLSLDLSDPTATAMLEVAATGTRQWYVAATIPSSPATPPSGAIRVTLLNDPQGPHSEVSYRDYPIALQPAATGNTGSGLVTVIGDRLFSSDFESLRRAHEDRP
ncbi:FG-GAP repeat domain-containing protein [Tahibacter amnicola]|uniref:VCBS repeat-containing protein n=1 Tax=Tahibacter amnicola TaxID=2976241 RepID=A0ABY6BGS0_9GAMM|nr:VCBS repeat-containing protein [Tahibacter amnicola]UXI68791.1 VCBS repeat-containing protein [Tahibacter amnicola]